MKTAPRNGLLIAGGGVVAAVIAAVIAGGATAVVTSGRPAAPTDENLVRAVLDEMNGSYNRSDFDAFASHLCADVLNVADYEAGWRRSRASDGPTRIDINSVSITGGPAPLAVANVRFHAANRPHTKTLDIDFRREGAGWKACRYHAARSI